MLWARRDSWLDQLSHATPCPFEAFTKAGLCTLHLPGLTTGLSPSLIRRSLPSFVIFLRCCAKMDTHRSVEGAIKHLGPRCRIQNCRACARSFLGSCSPSFRLPIWQSHWQTWVLQRRQNQQCKPSLRGHCQTSKYCTAWCPCGLCIFDGGPRSLEQCQGLSSVPFLRFVGPKVA